MKSDQLGKMTARAVQALTSWFSGSDVVVTEIKNWNTLAVRRAASHVIESSARVSSNLSEPTEVPLKFAELHIPSAKLVNSDTCRIAVSPSANAVLADMNAGVAAVELCTPSTIAIHSLNAAVQVPSAPFNVRVNFSSPTAMNIPIVSQTRPSVSSHSAGKIQLPRVTMILGTRKAGRSNDKFFVTDARSDLRSICLVPFTKTSSPWIEGDVAMISKIAERNNVTSSDITLLGVFRNVPIGAVSKIQIQSTGSSIMIWLDPDTVRNKKYKFCTLVVGRNTQSGRLLQAVI